MKAGVAKFYGLPYDESVPETEAASTEAEKEETQAETSGSEKKDTGDSNGYIFIYICHLRGSAGIGGCCGNCSYNSEKEEKV